MIPLVPKALRTVKWYVRYRPSVHSLVQRQYRTKKAAEAVQQPGEVVFQVKGFYFPSQVKQRKRRAQQHGAGHV